MYVIAFIHKNGGSRTVMGNTLQLCKERALKISKAFYGTYVAATIPYVVVKGVRYYNVDVPFEIKKGLGVELRLTLDENCL